MNTNLKVEIRLFKGNDDLKAFADVTLRVKFGEITIRRFKIIQGEKKPWVAFPQVQYLTFFNTKYADLLSMNKRVEDYIKNQILNEYRKKINSDK